MNSLSENVFGGYKFSDLPKYNLKSTIYFTKGANFLWLI